jgi:hypothetical protein
LAALGNRRDDVAINHWTVQWCTGLSGESSAPVPKSSTTNSSLSGKTEGAAAKIHRTVRWCTGLSGESTVPVANGGLRDQRETRGSANGWMVAPDYLVCTGLCPGVPTDPKIQRSASPEKKRDRALDCLVHHSTEGKNCLPS